MKAIAQTIIVLTLAALLAGAAQAGSIYAKSGKTRALHSDDTAREIGDLLTIVISETTTIANDTSRDLSKKSARDATISGNLDILRVLDKLTKKLFNFPSMSVDMEAENTFEGGAEYDSSRSMTDQITVTVADVLPNGNLVVVGTRVREVAGDKQIMEVGGVVRPSDITFTNTVQSDQVAEFKVVFRHKGRENRFTKPGWLSQLLNFINPF